jgi:hypothetical protein
VRAIPDTLIECSSGYESGAFTPVTRANIALYRAKTGDHTRAAPDLSDGR